jgi:hypothetical protein
MQADAMSQIISGFEKLEIEYSEATKKLMAAKSFLTNEDIRIAPFRKCFHVIQSTHISMDLFDKYVGEDDWWTKYYPDMSLIQSRSVAIDYDRFHRLAFLHLLHFAIDSSMRAIGRAIDPNAVSSGTGKSTEVYPFVLDELKLNRYRGLLCIIRLLRNAAHNNGTHTGNTVTLKLKGQPYTFEKDKEPILYAWLPFIEIAKEVKSLFVDVANSEKLLSSTILDPNAVAMKEFRDNLFRNKGNTQHSSD